MASTTTSEMKLPEWQKEFLTGSVLPLAEEIASADFVPYTGSFTPEMSDYTTRAGGLYGDIAQMGSSAPSISDYTTRAGGIYGDIANLGQMTPQDYAARTQANMNPYQSEVIDSSLALMGRQQEKARTESEARLIGSGAFGGGGRRAVYEAEFDTGNLSNQNQLIAQMMQQGYSQAQAQTMAQLSQQQGALGAGAAGLSGVGATDTAQRMAQLSFERDSLGAAAAGLSGVGATETALQNQELQARYAEFARENDLPLSQLNALLSAASGIPAGLGTQTNYDPYGGLTAFGNVLSGAADAAGAVVTMGASKAAGT